MGLDTVNPAANQGERSDQEERSDQGERTDQEERRDQQEKDGNQESSYQQAQEERSGRMMGLDTGNPAADHEAGMWIAALIGTLVSAIPVAFLSPSLGFKKKKKRSVMETMVRIGVEDNVNMKHREELEDLKMLKDSVHDIIQAI